jgi:RNA polymerase sigma-70 factor (ECF subfamily)
MPSSRNPDTDHLLQRVAQGDVTARGPLLEPHRARLRQTIALRLDRRLATRVDPSDVVQETLGEADIKLSGCLRTRPLPFYPWLRSLALQRLADLHRRHVRTQRRSIRREDFPLADVPDESAQALIQRLYAPGSNPSARLHRHEAGAIVRSALARLRERDRELLVLRHVEQLSIREISGVLGISEGAVKVRHVRALERLRDRLKQGPQEQRQ